MAQSFWNIVWEFFSNGLTIQPSNCTLRDLFQKKIRHFHIGAYMQMFITVLLKNKAT